MDGQCPRPKTRGIGVMSKRFTDPQKEFLSKIERSIDKLYPLVSQARMLRLYIVERELAWTRQGLVDALELQRRAYLDDSLTSKEPLLVNGIDKSR